MSRIFSSIDELIGATPILRLSKLEEKLGLSAELYAKLEYFNPLGSAKDRVALSMIRDFEERGLLHPGSVIIEATSGNTGIGLSAVGTARGYRTIIVMPENMSEERKKIMRALGAELVLTDASLGMAGAIAKSEEIKSEIPDSIIAGQFVNPANVEAHYTSTGPEIYRDMDGEIDFFVAGVGTGGTITGVGTYLKEQNRGIKVIAAEPKGSPVLSGGNKGSHGLQGIGAGFIPEILDTGIYDEVVCVSEDDAYSLGRLVGKCEGVLVGISSGAALYAAVEIARRPESFGKKIVVLLPDTGERYLSSPMFDY